MAALAVLTGCKEEPPLTGQTEDHYKELTDMGMYDRSGAVYLYDEKAAQYAVSTARNAMRIQNDDKSIFIAIVMEAAPEVGYMTGATFTSRGISIDGSAKELNIKTIKMENGKVWLMDETGENCFVMPWTGN